ncbi:MAG TPA: glucose-6-phosphate isomerase [Erysipelothrix sp.]|jgi:glucose-6-phosphate isomerase|nr:glucose-6-phosphate isomerase [Erysipelothrix sp.]
MIKLNTDHLLFEPDFNQYQDEVSRIHRMIIDKTGKGNDFLGWVDWPFAYDKEEFDRIKVAAQRIREQADILLVCGIGGSYLGAKAAIDFIKGNYAQDDLEIIYVGNTFSSTEIVRVLKYIEGKDVALNVISKSGSTTETALAFRIFRQHIEKQYGKGEATNRIYVTTDKERGLLRPLVNKVGYESFIIPDDIGGRFSVITAVGLLPIAAAGIDIDAMMNGLQDAYKAFTVENVNHNDAYKYGVLRRVLQEKGLDVEMFVTYEPHLSFVAEWLKQLDGESEGKEGKGILPHSVTNSTDLHSMGQYVQEGKKILFETILTVHEPLEDMEFPSDNDDTDQMEYLASKSLHWVNQQAMLGTLEAHTVEGQVPNIVLEIKDNSAYTFGYMVFFFFMALAMSAYKLDINPFDQPGVEVYKRNMFKLLGKE